MRKALIISIIIVVIVIIAAIVLLSLNKAPTPATEQQQTQVSGVSGSDVNSVGTDVNAIDDSEFNDNVLADLG